MNVKKKLSTRISFYYFKSTIVGGISGVSRDFYLINSDEENIPTLGALDFFSQGQIERLT